MNTAEQQGKLKPGGTVVAATSGNTGASVAMIAAMKGYKYIGTQNLSSTFAFADYELLLYSKYDPGISFAAHCQTDVLCILQLLRMRRPQRRNVMQW